MSKSYPLSVAKDNLSELVRAAERGQKIVITKRGKPAVAIVSLTVLEGIKGKKTNLVEAFRSSPLVGLDLDFSRLDDPLRDEIDFS